MKYTSTRGGGAPLSFSDAVLTGLARDGGLLLPASYPDVRDRLADWGRLPYPELAFEVMRLFADDIPDCELRAVVERSYSVFSHPETTPVVPVGPVNILELFHGPTLAFKDVALQFLGNLFELLLKKRGGRLNIVVATSGDTGSAAIHGIRGRDNMSIFVLHPDGRVSPVQELQMTTVLDANVRNLAIAGSFDDCQSIVKGLFGDLEFRDRHSLGAVNSINWARVLAQVVYYFYAAFRTMERTGAEKVRFTVPTGNFGDIFAGYVAWRMGLPIDKLVLATNENDILSRYFNTGIYARGKVAPTISPSTDIQVASNFERYLYHRSGDDPAPVREWMAAFRETGRLETPVPAGAPVDPLFLAGSGDTDATLATIKEFWTRHRYLLDPHTAVGVSVALKNLSADAPMICLATAHPAKFGGAVKAALGEDIARHPSIDALRGLPSRQDRLPADQKAVAEYIARTLS